LYHVGVELGQLQLLVQLNIVGALWRMTKRKIRMRLLHTLSLLSSPSLHSRICANPSLPLRRAMTRLQLEYRRSRHITPVRMPRTMRNVTNQL